MDDGVPRRIDKLHKVEAFSGIPVTAWVGNPLLINGIGYRRVSGKDGGANSLDPAAAEIRYAVTLGLRTLVIYDPCLPHSYSPGEF